MADFRCFTPDRKVIDIRGVELKYLAVDEFYACMSSRYTNAVLVIAEQCGSTVLVDNRKIRIEPQL